MPTKPTSAPLSLPTWLKVVCSAFAVAHLSIIGIYSLAAESGPWPLGVINSTSPGPKFATDVTLGFSYPCYLQPLHLTNNYHFASNRPNEFAVYFTIEVKDRLGEIKVRKFPDEKANPWVRHRQELIAQHLVPDLRLPPRGSRRLAAKGKELPKIEIFKPDGERVLRLAEVTELDPALDTPDLDQPTPRSKAIARAYARYVCDQQNGTSAQLVRHSRPLVMPVHLIVPMQADMYKELRTYFGEYRRE
jgi:hypothetical protein